jgi:hypothetical protein
MDRSQNSAAFILVRTDDEGATLKTFVVGVNASGSTGEFIINDLGSEVGGAGQRRMTISNSGDTTFTGAVTATEYFQPSSFELKSDILALENPFGKLSRLRGVQFDWKQTGRPSFGFIAEEVAEVMPQLLSWDQKGQKPKGVNYSPLIGLLIEAAKVQAEKIDTLEKRREHLEALLDELKKVETTSRTIERGDSP